MKIKTLQEYAHHYLDGLYNPEFPNNAQCSGWNILLNLVKFDIKPTNLHGLHENVRSRLIQDWENIKKLKYE